MTRPLDGIRVLDFTRHMAGPYGTMILGDYGADIIKVESLPHGDGARGVGTAFIDGESALFLIWNRGKRSLALDMRKPQGLEVVHRLAATADVVVTSYRPGVADEIGIGYDELSAINDQIVYVSLTAFGPDGPLSPLSGHRPGGSGGLRSHVGNRRARPRAQPGRGSHGRLHRSSGQRPSRHARPVGPTADRQGPAHRRLNALRTECRR